MICPACVLIKHTPLGGNIARKCKSVEKFGRILKLSIAICNFTKCVSHSISNTSKQAAFNYLEQFTIKEYISTALSWTISIIICRTANIIVA